MVSSSSNNNLFLQADDIGNWFYELNLDQINLDSGLHNLVLEDESGQQQNIYIYIKKEMKELTQGFNYYKLGFFSLILFFVLIVISKKINLSYKKIKFDFNKKVLVYGLIIIVLSLGLFWLIKNKSTEHKEFTVPDNKLKAISGLVVEPLEQQPISGLNLSLNEVSITTDKSGYYSFTDLKKQDNFIRLNEPNLKQAFKIYIKNKSKMNIYFDVDLYNLLFEILNLESDNKYGIIYNKLSPELKTKINKNDFINCYQDVVDKDFKQQQSIDILDVDLLEKILIEDMKFTKIIKFKVLINNKVDNYYFIKNNNNWLFLSKHEKKLCKK